MALIITDDRHSIAYFSEKGNMPGLPITSLSQSYVYLGSAKEEFVLYLMTHFILKRSVSAEECVLWAHMSWSSKNCYCRRCHFISCILRQFEQRHSVWKRRDTLDRFVILWYDGNVVS